jgi:outer membrane cobalamin receptor
MSCWNFARSLALVSLIVMGITPLAAADEASPPPAPAEESSTFEEEILVTATRRAEEVGDIPASVTVVTAKQIAALPVVSLEGALQVEVPGFTLGRPGSDSYAMNTINSQAVSLRGLGATGASRTLVVLDGVPLNDPIGGWIDWGRIPLDSVEQVEVVRTATTTAWGNQAMGGVINIVTRRPDGRRLLAHVEGGSHELRRLEFSLSEAWGRHGVVLGAKLFEVGGFIAHAEELRGPVDVPRSAEQESVTGEWRFDASPSASYSVGGHWAGERRTTDTRLDQNSSVQFTLRAGGHWTRPASVWEARAYALQQDQAARRVSVNAARTVVTPNSDQYGSPASAWGATTQWNRALGERHVALAGVDWISGEADVNEDLRFSGGRFTRRRVFGGSTQLGGLFFEDEFRPNDTWSLRLGGRLDRWSSGEGRRNETDLLTGATLSSRSFEEHEVTVFNPSLAGLFKLGSGAALRGSI